MLTIQQFAVKQFGSVGYINNLVNQQLKIIQPMYITEPTTL